MLEDIVDSISVNNLRDITIWANGNHKNINCIIDDLLGASCFCCPYCISDNLPKCAFGKLSHTLEWGNGIKYVWQTKPKRFNELDGM